MDSTSTTILLCGVGGQGALLAAKLISRVALNESYYVKVSEIHGMSQRGGSVTTVIRFDKEKVYSMTADKAEVDYLVAFDQLEALRYASYLKPEGKLLVSDKYQEPITVATGSVPAPVGLINQLKELKAIFVPAYEIATKCGSSRALNIAMSGALSLHLPFKEETWEEVMAEIIPQKILSINQETFKQARALG